LAQASSTKKLKKPRKAQLFLETIQCLALPQNPDNFSKVPRSGTFEKLSGLLKPSISCSCRHLYNDKEPKRERRRGAPPFSFGFYSK